MFHERLKEMVGQLLESRVFVTGPRLLREKPMSDARLARNGHCQMIQTFVHVLSFLSVVATSHLSRLQEDYTWSFHTPLSAVALYIEPYTQGN